MNPNETQQIEIVVQRGYHADRASLAAGIPARVRFVRREAGGCSREVIFPTLGIRRELPQDVPVTIDLPAQPAGTIAFTCGMNMMRGSIPVVAA